MAAGGATGESDDSDDVEDEEDFLGKLWKESAAARTRSEVATNRTGLSSRARRALRRQAAVVVADRPSQERRARKVFLAVSGDNLQVVKNIIRCHKNVVVLEEVAGGHPAGLPAVRLKPFV
eukprot:SAG22_NODE_965_length_6268_cov_30.435403_2_plen_121_part_00